MCYKFVICFLEQRSGFILLAYTMDTGENFCERFMLTR